VKHTRNKVRHELLPLLEREYNPNIYQQLADMAEVARTEEEYWAQMVRNQQPELRMELLLNQPLAFRRRLVREAFFKASGNRLDFEHTEELVRLLDLRESSRLQLPERWFAVLDWPKRVVRFEELAGTVAEKRESKLKKKEAGRGRREAGKAGPSLRSG
jgi:tRNA(Ile)-lysidine synthase